MVAYYLFGTISVMLIIMPVFLGWLDSLTPTLLWALLVAVLDLTGRVVWEYWREERSSADDP